MKFWIARDEDGSLWMFDDKPIKIKNFWGVNRESEKYIQPKPARPLYDWHFPEVTFENSPQMVEIKLVKDMIECFADEPQEKMVSLNKVCELLKNIIDDDVLVKCGSVIKCMDVDDFVLYFREAMEE